jgi:FKBP-type peptidyl-prolyl cis-trans isomerase FkpA
MLRAVIICFLLWVINTDLHAQEDRTPYALPDSVQMQSFLTAIKISAEGKVKHLQAGMGTERMKLYLQQRKKTRSASMAVLPYTKEKRSGFVLAATDLKRDGINPDAKQFDWETDTEYKLLLASSGDSAENFMLYSGYVYLPRQNKWKLIGVYLSNGHWGPMKTPYSFIARKKNTKAQYQVTEAWAQRTRGGWKNLLTNEAKAPVM